MSSRAILDTMWRSIGCGLVLAYWAARSWLFALIWTSVSKDVDRGLEGQKAALFGGRADWGGALRGVEIGVLRSAPASEQTCGTSVAAPRVASRACC